MVVFAVQDMPDRLALDLPRPSPSYRPSPHCQNTIPMYGVNMHINNIPLSEHDTGYPYDSIHYLAAKLPRHKSIHVLIPEHSPIPVCPVACAQVPRCLLAVSPLTLTQDIVVYPRHRLICRVMDNPRGASPGT